MSYDTYSGLLALLNEQQTKLENAYLIACRFIPYEGSKNYEKTASAKAYKIYQTDYAKLEKMKKELEYAAAAVYRNHPTEEMRKFWRVKELGF